jgi:hypothetical protein
VSIIAAIAAGSAFATSRVLLALVPLVASPSTSAGASAVRRTAGAPREATVAAVHAVVAAIDVAVVPALLPGDVEHVTQLSHLLLSEIVASSGSAAAFGSAVRGYATAAVLLSSASRGPGSSDGSGDGDAAAGVVGHLFNALVTSTRGEVRDACVEQLRRLCDHRGFTAVVQSVVVDAHLATLRAAVDAGGASTSLRVEHPDALQASDVDVVLTADPVSIALHSLASLCSCPQVLLATLPSVCSIAFRRSAGAGGAAPWSVATDAAGGTSVAARLLQAIVTNVEALHANAAVMGVCAGGSGDGTPALLPALISTVCGSSSSSSSSSGSSVGGAGSGGSGSSGVEAMTSCCASVLRSVAVGSERAVQGAVRAAVVMAFLGEVNMAVVDPTARPLASALLDGMRGGAAATLLKLLLCAVGHGARGPTVPMVLCRPLCHRLLTIILSDAADAAAATVAAQCLGCVLNREAKSPMIDDLVAEVLAAKLVPAAVDVSAHALMRQHGE